MRSTAIEPIVAGSPSGRAGVPPAQRFAAALPIPPTARAAPVLPAPLAPRAAPAPRPAPGKAPALPGAGRLPPRRPGARSRW